MRSTLTWMRCFSLYCGGRPKVVQSSGRVGRCSFAGWICQPRMNHSQPLYCARAIRPKSTSAPEANGQESSAMWTLTRSPLNRLLRLSSARAASTHVLLGLVETSGDGAEIQDLIGPGFDNRQGRPLPRSLGGSSSWSTIQRQVSLSQAPQLTRSLAGGDTIPVPGLVSSLLC
jgi:hypothetical protein